MRNQLLIKILPPSNLAKDTQDKFGSTKSQ